MTTRPVGRPPKNDGEPTKRKRFTLTNSISLQLDTERAKQSQTDYLLQAMNGVISGRYDPVTTRAPFVKDPDRRTTEISVPLSLLTKIERITEDYSITFTDFVLGAWQHRREAEGH